MPPRNTLPKIPGGSSLLRDAMGDGLLSEESKSSQNGRDSRGATSAAAYQPKFESQSVLDAKATSKVKVPFNLPADLAESIRDAVFALSGPPHCLSLASLAENALRTELARLEATANAGRRFLARQGPLRPGRRVG